MVELLGMQSADEAHIICYGLQVREQIGNPNTGFSTFFKFVFGFLGCTKQSWTGTDKGELFAFEHFLGAELPVSFLELRFIVKKIEM